MGWPSHGIGGNTNLGYGLDTRKLVDELIVQAISKRMKLWYMAQDDQIMWGTENVHIYASPDSGIKYATVVTTPLVPKGEAWIWNPAKQDFDKFWPLPKPKEEFDVDEYNKAILDSPEVWE